MQEFIRVIYKGSGRLGS